MKIKPKKKEARAAAWHRITAARQNREAYRRAMAADSWRLFAGSRDPIFRSGCC